MDALTPDVRDAIDLAPRERVVRVVVAVGCTLVVTDRRLLLVREGASFRPKTGVQSWPLDQHLRLQLSRGRQDTRRLLIIHDERPVSVFLPITQRAAIDALIAEVRKRTYGDP
jgi:hypothetical protein